MLNSGAADTFLGAAVLFARKTEEAAASIRVKQFDIVYFLNRQSHPPPAVQALN